MHQPVGKMRIHHLQLGFTGLRQFPVPISKAARFCQSDHFRNDSRTGIPQNECPAGFLILIDHGIEGFDQSRHIKGINISEGFLKLINELILNALQQCKAVTVMGIESSPVDLG